MDKERPISVSIIAWVIIVMGGLTLLGIPRLFLIYKMSDYQQLLVMSGLSLETNISLNVVAGLVYLASGIAMLKGLNWDRLLYLWAMGVLMLFSIFILGFSPMAIPGIILYIVFLALLTRPVASTFFSWYRKVKTQYHCENCTSRLLLKAIFLRE